MCCLVGNDFLCPGICLRSISVERLLVLLARQLRPHIAAVDIYDGGLDKLLAAYYRLKPALNGHLDLEIVASRFRV